MPEEANGIIEWFEIYYIRGKIRRITRSGNVIRSDPLFPPSLWSVTENMEYAFPRTQNFVEAWLITSHYNLTFKLDCFYLYYLCFVILKY